MAEQNALVKLERSVSAAIDNPVKLAEMIREWKSMANVLSPVAHISALAPQHVVSPSIVLLDTRWDQYGVGVDVYHSGVFHKKSNECALGKVALNKIASAGGASFTTERTDDRRIPLYWEMKARLVYTDFDGKQRVIERTAEVDLRDGSPQLAGMKDGQIQQARRFGLRLCEAKACNAAARDAWGIQSKYTVEDLQKPFVVLRVAFVPDMADPVQRRLVAERALGGAAALYPQRQIQEPDVIDVEPVREGQAAAATTTTIDGETANTQSGELVDDKKPAAPAEPTGPLVTDVREESGITKDKYENGKLVKKGGKPFKRYFVTLDDGRVLHTFDAGSAKAADDFRQTKRPVEVQTTTSKFGLDLVEIMPASARLPLDEDDNTPTDDDLPQTQQHPKL